MAHGAVLFIGCLVVWVCATLSAGWPQGISLGFGAMASLLVVTSASGMGVLDGEGTRHLTRAAVSLGVSVSRFPKSVLSALGVVAAVFGYKRGRPGFVRLTLRPHDGPGLAAVVEALSAAPGLAVVDADAGSLLAHTLDEDGADVARLAALERRVAGGERERAS